MKRRERKAKGIKNKLRFIMKTYQFSTRATNIIYYEHVLPPFSVLFSKIKKYSLVVTKTAMIFFYALTIKKLLIYTIVVKTMIEEAFENVGVRGWTQTPQDSQTTPIQ